MMIEGKGKKTSERHCYVPPIKSKGCGKVTKNIQLKKVDKEAKLLKLKVI